ncbi:MAG: hypothetical protein Q4D56_10175, partial [Bacteroides sp.]|nr:hypothetical protein [Bacteroides sp.]
ILMLIIVNRIQFSYYSSYTDSFKMLRAKVGTAYAISLRIAKLFATKNNFSTMFRHLNIPQPQGWLFVKNAVFFSCRAPSIRRKHTA